MRNRSYEYQQKEKQKIWESTRTYQETVCEAASVGGAEDGRLAIKRMDPR